MTNDDLLNSRQPAVANDIPFVAFSGDERNDRLNALHREFGITLHASSSPGSKSEQFSWNRRISTARSKLSSRGFAIVRGFLPSRLMYLVGSYYQSLASEGLMGFDDGQSVRYWAHNEQFALWLHNQISCSVERLVCESIKPSYSYVCFYVGGSELPRHTDRPECEYTLSLAVCSTPSTLDPWPLYLDVPGRRRSFGARLNPGDALIFRGREIPHYRKRLSDSCTSCSILFHFVPKGFSGSLR